ncbi:tetratricopeptide repeat protein [Ferrovibrio terrae]|uniref:Tetratricopeptide repeat protein n=1 Tax=Ferrovibrio terrae TaxID=2594003 RepID=A0A516H515_9PROT|nr:tetratricopeptide repeat protein [Ferrovibrio terrae]QDO98827.1 tetratricopeptide repeat protein [Ferrovibrio terrae]
MSAPPPSDTMPAATAQTDLQNLQAGLEAHRRGDLPTAERLYRLVLQTAPDTLDAYNLLGRLLVQGGRVGDAIPLLRHALDRNPGQSGLWISYAEALLTYGAHEAAREAAEKARQLAPKDPDVLYVWAETQRAASAWIAAADGYRRLLAVRPDHAGAWLQLATCLQAMGDLPAAKQAAERAVQHAPQAPECHNNLGSLHAASDDHAAALPHFERALALRPNYPAALINKGASLRETGQAADAVLLLQQAMALTNGHPQAVAGLAQARHSLGQIDEARQLYRDALAREPNDAETQWNYALAALTAGDFAAGWQAYAWRWRKAMPPLPHRAWPWPVWTENDIAGKRLLIWGEQGLGDRLMLLQFLPALIEDGAKVTLETDPRLIPLLQRSFAGIDFAAEGTHADPELLQRQFDGHRPLGDLAVTAPPGKPILRADPIRSNALAGKYRGDSRDRLVGLSWRSANPTLGAAKSLSIPELAPLAAIAGLRFVCLQYGATPEEHAALRSLFGDRYIVDPGIDAKNDLAGLADQIAALDLTVTVSNITAHLAGSLGRPVWLLAPASGRSLFFYLMAEGEGTPWYAGMRIFRRSHDRGAESQLEAVAKGLELLAK